MLRNKSEEHVVSGAEIAAVIDKGPDYASQKFDEFLKDIETISDSISNLYHDGDNSNIFTLLGVKVDISVELCSKKAAEVHLGGEMQDNLRKKLFQEVKDDDKVNWRK